MEAEHKASGKSYAIKVISRHEDQIETVDQLYESQLQRLIQPFKKVGLMGLSECIIDEGFIYFVRPLYNRRSLCSKLSRDAFFRQLTEQELHRGARTLCKALYTIHWVGFLHGDVRPQSIFLHKDDKRGGKLKLALGNFEHCCPIDKKVEQEPISEENVHRLLYLAPEAIRTEE